MIYDDYNSRDIRYNFRGTKTVRRFCLRCNTIVELLCSTFKVDWNERKRSTKTQTMFFYKYNRDFFFTFNMP